MARVSDECRCALVLRKSREQRWPPILAATPKKNRNDALNTAALLLAKLVAAGALVETEVRSALFNACVANKLVHDDGRDSVRRTIQSGYEAGINEPWSFKAKNSDRPEDDGDGDDAARRRTSGAWPYQSAKDFRTDYNRDWIIKNVIAPGEVSNFCGEPGKGKSALAGDISLHICAGKDCRGYKSKKRGGIVYFALERADLVKRRFNAQCDQYGIDPKTLPFHVVGVTIDMMERGCIQRFLDTIHATEEDCGVPVVMIVVDTSAKAIAAGDGEENSAKDKNILRANARRVMDEIPGLHVMFVSHTGKDPDKEERGSNAGKGDDDMLVMLNGQTAVIKKRNDGPEGLLTNYGMKSIIVGADEDGDQIDIAIVDPDTSQKAAPTRVRLKGQPKMALDFLAETINEAGVSPPASLPVSRAVSRVVRIEQWEEQCRRRNLAGGEGEAFRKAFDRAADKLQEIHLISILDGWAWILYE
jgi:AAA domain